jgi:hypothetical protein
MHTRRRLNLLLLAAALAIAPRAAAEIPAAVRAAILAAPPGAALDVHVASVPASVRAVAFPLMVEPGQPFQVTDVIGPNDHLPAGRLTWGLRLGRYYLLHSEFGGIAHAFYVRVYDLTPAGAKLVCSSIVATPFRTLAALQAAVRADRLQTQ